MSDALKWAALSREQRVKLCLHDIAKFFSDVQVDVHEQYIDAFDILWSDEYCAGDAMFLPGQFSRFHDAARRPEGNIHFASEHLSKHHTWIAGALDSALTSVEQLIGKTVPALGKEHDVTTTKLKSEENQQVLTNEASAGSSKPFISRSFSIPSRFVIPFHLNV